MTYEELQGWAEVGKSEEKAAEQQEVAQKKAAARKNAGARAEFYMSAREPSPRAILKPGLSDAERLGYPTYSFRDGRLISSSGNPLETIGANSLKNAAEVYSFIGSMGAGATKIAKSIKAAEEAMDASVAAVNVSTKYGLIMRPLNWAWGKVTAIPRTVRDYFKTSAKLARAERSLENAQKTKEVTKEALRRTVAEFEKANGPGIALDRVKDAARKIYKSELQDGTWQKIANAERRVEGLRKAVEAESAAGKAAAKVAKTMEVGDKIISGAETAEHYVNRAARAMRSEVAREINGGTWYQLFKKAHPKLEKTFRWSLISSGVVGLFKGYSSIKDAKVRGEEEAKKQKRLGEVDKAVDETWYAVTNANRVTEAFSDVNALREYMRRVENAGRHEFDMRGGSDPNVAKEYREWLVENINKTMESAIGPVEGSDAWREAVNEFNDDRNIRKMAQQYVQDNFDKFNSDGRLTGPDAKNSTKGVLREVSDRLRALPEPVKVTGGTPFYFTAPSNEGR